MIFIGSSITAYLVFHWLYWQPQPNTYSHVCNNTSIFWSKNCNVSVRSSLEARIHLQVEAVLHATFIMTHAVTKTHLLVLLSGWEQVVSLFSHIITHCLTQTSHYIFCLMYSIVMLILDGKLLMNFNMNNVLKRRNLVFFYIILIYSCTGFGWWIRHIDSFNSKCNVI